MPISEALHATGASEYSDARAAFRAQHGIGHGDVVATFHAVRTLQYHSGPDRSALTALREGRGACTARHVLLRDLLRDMALQADVELVEGDFAAGLRDARGLPDDLAGMIADGGVRDVHAWVRLRTGAGAIRLDATWPDTLAEFGVATNRDWDGRGDTRPAMPGARPRGRPEDVLEEKARLLKALSRDEAARRARFLARLSEWLGQVAAQDRRGRGSQ